MRKSADARAVALDPVLRLYYVEVDQPDMHRARGDLERLAEALDKQWGLTGLAAELDVLQKLQTALRRGAWKVTVAVHDGTRIIAVWPGYQGAAYGLAVDIGSTTIAAHLTDLLSGETKASAGLMNPQIRFGEDLMSRVSYVMMNPGGEVEMTRAVRDAVSQLAAEVAEAAGIDLGLVLEMVVVGNPIMHHLFLGIDPTQLGMAPFALAVDGALDLPARELGQGALHPGARVYVLPCIAGHVGADAAGMVLAQGPHLTDEMLLLVDVGTNAEIVLGNRERLLACSSPTGPAFEGAQISAGQRAAPGAIERVRIDRATLEPRFKVIGSDLWSDEPGFSEAVALSGVTGICGSGIIEVVAELFLAGIVTADGVIDGRLAARTARIEATGRTFSYLLHEGEPVIRVTQGDIRAIQLAKAALHAGCRLLMDRLGIEQGRPDHAGRGLRQPHRPAPRPGPGPRAGLRARPRPQRRQRRRHGRPDRAPEPRRPPRDRGAGRPHRENRDGDRARVPAPLRRGDGLPAQDRPLRGAGPGRDASRAGAARHGRARAAPRREPA